MPKDQDGQVIQYVDNFAWGITPSGKTVCLGEEAGIKEAIASPRKKANDLVVAQIIFLERQLLKQEKQKEVKIQAKVETVRKERHQRAKELGVAKAVKPRRRRKQ